MERYDYPTTDTANGLVNLSVLGAQATAAGLPTLGALILDGLPAGNGLYKDGTIQVLSEDPLDDDQVQLLGEVVAAHVGKVTIGVSFKATAEVVHAPVTVDADWMDLGGVVTSVDFFIPDLTRAFARVVGSYRADGAGVELRIVMGLGDNPKPMSAVAKMPDTQGEWALIPSFNSNIPPMAGQTLYRLQGRRNAAIDASVQFTSLSLLELDA